jgi:hypothetical protein
MKPKENHSQIPTENKTGRFITKIDKHKPCGDNGSLVWGGGSELTKGCSLACKLNQ